MNTGWPSLDMTFVFVVVPGIAGIVALRRGLWPRRRGSTPYCAGCGYNLTMLTSDRCPECGADTTPAGAIVTGERRRRLGLILLGVGCLLVAVSPVVNSLLGVDWYQYKPTIWVLKDLESSNGTLSQKAWDEIERRLKRYGLSASQRSTLVDLGLTEQIAATSRNVSDSLLQFLGAAYVAGELSEKQQHAFLDQSIDCDIVVRKRCSPEDPVPLATHVINRPLPVIPLRYTFTFEEFRLDGKDSSSPIRNWAYERPASLTGGSSSRKSYLRDIAPGHHLLRVRVSVKTFMCDEAPTAYGNFGADTVRYEKEWGPAIRDRTIELKKTFEVLPDEPENYMTLVRDPAIASELPEFIQLTKIGLSWGRLPGRREEGWRWRYWNATGTAPGVLSTNVAADVYLRIDGQEYLAGRATGSEGDRQIQVCIQGITGHRAPFESADLVLRPNERIAQETVDMCEIWGGVIVKEGIEVNCKEDASGR